MDKVIFAILLLIMMLVIGLGICAIVEARRNTHHISGCLRIDRSDEDGPMLFLDLDEDIETISRQKTVSFVVMNKDILPREEQSL